MRETARLVSVLLVTLVLCTMGFGGCRAFVQPEEALPNFFTVSPTLYRGARPSREGFARLREMGVKTVVNLRTTQPDRDWLAELGFNYENRPMTALTPSDEDVIWFLRIAIDPQRTPVFVYCNLGSDRTGYMVAMYRVVVEHWDRERAIEEMTAEDKGFVPIFWNLIDYVRDADIEAIRAAVYAPGPGPAPGDQPHEGG